MDYFCLWLWIYSKTDRPSAFGWFSDGGFCLEYFCVQNSVALEHIADFGVLLLLFNIGLKLKVKNLLKPEIWAGSSVHMLIITIIFGLFIFGLSLIGFSKFTNLNLESSFLIAFALSFSSTIFAVKILEETGSMKSTHGRIAMGILVIQDIFAVIFLTLSSGNTPSVWAFGLLLLLFVQRLIKNRNFSFFLNKAGHGELLI